MISERTMAGHGDARQQFLDYAALRMAEGLVPFRGAWVRGEERSALIRAAKRRRRVQCFEAVLLIIGIFGMGACLFGLTLLLAYA